MAAAAPERPELERPELPDWLSTVAVLLIGAVAAMWIIEIADTLVLGDRLQRQGIMPRSWRGLDGVLWAPLLHGGFGHLLTNTLPFLVLGGLVAARGIGRFMTITAIVVLGGGLATWLFGTSGNHIGASGVVFGYFGALLGAAVFERKFVAIIAALFAGALYWTLIFGIMPRPFVSWESHLFGLLAGIAAAKLLANAKPDADPTPS